MSTEWYYIILASLAFGILLAVFQDWWDKRQRRKRRR